MTCPGGLILHADGTVQGCTLDDEPDGCRGARYDMKAARLDFVLRDDTGDTIPVVYHKPKPETFDMADKIKVIGAYRDGVFQADEMILKCPSKYNTAAPTPGKPGDKTAPYAALGKGA